MSNPNPDQPGEDEALKLADEIEQFDNIIISTTDGFWSDRRRLTNDECALILAALRSLASAPPTEGLRCICQDQHRRGYCTEPGCPYAAEARTASLETELAGCTQLAIYQTERADAAEAQVTELAQHVDGCVKVAAEALKARQDAEAQTASLVKALEEAKGALLTK